MSEPPIARKRPRHLWLALWNQLSRVDRKLLCGAAIVMAAGCGLTAIQPIFIGQLVEHTVSHHGITLGSTVGPLGAIGLLVIIAQLLEVTRRQLVETVATGFERDARHSAYGHLMRLDPSYLRRGKVGGIHGRAERSIEGAVKLIKLGAMDLLPAMTLAISAIVVAFTRQPLVAASMALVVPTGLLLVGWQVHNQKGVRIQVRDHKDDIDGQVIELLPRMAVVRATGARPHFMGMIQNACEQLRSTELRHHRAMSLFDAAKAINEGVWLLVTLAVAISVDASGRFSAGQLTVYVLLYGGVVTPLRELHRIVDEAAESGQQANDLFALLAEPEDESFRTTARQGAEPARADAPAVEMSQVTFTHAGRSEAALDDVSLQIRLGERVGLVGKTGGGKSTLLKLLRRLHHGFGGAIRIAGRDIREIHEDELVNLVGWVSQEPTMFAGTVRENITLGHPDATPEEVVQAAQRASVHEDIMRMPLGYETRVAEGGETLSGGQCQRLCLARAIIRVPPLLLLDEPTSALDGPSQVAVQRAIDNLEGVTLLIVAHRLDTLQTMDRIMVMDKGGIVEEGSFANLAHQKGLFTRMLLSGEAEAA